jgi:hypothetical protein
MGLGKTLVILSTIAATVDQASAFIREVEEVWAQNSPQRGTKACRATLIVAPSARREILWKNFDGPPLIKQQLFWTAGQKKSASTPLTSHSNPLFSLFPL